MRVIYILSHHDDELGAWPLIARFNAMGSRQTFIFMTACGDGDTPIRRQQETMRALAACGLSNPECLFVGYDHDIPTYYLHEHLPRARALLREAVSSDEQLTIVTHAWEGGHVDHDMCFALSCWLLPQLGPQTDFLQFSLYNMRGLRWPVYRAVRPIPENGPVIAERLSAKSWLRYLQAARYYPSQWRVLLTLWPSMLATFALQGGYRYQAGRPDRVRERPHQGPLMYEQVRRGAYDDIRERVAQLFTAAN